MDRDVFGHIIDSFEGEPARRVEQFRRGILDLQQALSVIEEIRMPVISAIQGAYIGGDMDLICATDMRFCSADAFFMIKETELGITADVGTLQ
jgi:enoyl-CoA hydratase